MTRAIPMAWVRHFADRVGVKDISTTTIGKMVNLVSNAPYAIPAVVDNNISSAYKTAAMVPEMYHWGRQAYKNRDNEDRYTESVQQLGDVYAECKQLQLILHFAPRRLQDTVF
ncbi:unnamed protein product [Sphagnum jensenii]|uniref:Uncharacterized protein n=1 Tax=Sphagnum jensenii TaxID=128206 RepID=A0ABP1A1J9_9BRYO